MIFSGFDFDNFDSGPSGRSRRRGNPTLGSQPQPSTASSVNSDPIFKPEQLLQVAPNSQPDWLGVGIQPQIQTPFTSNPVGVTQIPVATSGSLQQLGQDQQTIHLNNPSLEKSLSMHNEILRQMTQFERTQQLQFEKDLEEQRKILEAKQLEYRVRF